MSDESLRTTHIVGNQTRFVLLQCPNDTLERRSHIGEVGNTTTDDEDLAVWTRSAANNEIDDSLGVFIGLTLRRSTGIFAIVGKLVCEAVCSNSISIYDGCTSSCGIGTCDYKNS